MVPFALTRLRFFLSLLNLLSLICLAGCGSRQPIVDRRQPPPLTPAPVPAETAEAAKRDTDIDPAPAPAPRRAARMNSSGNRVAEGFAEEGNASWYGVPFHGRRASNGEIYDMNQLTAAHRTLPFETTVRVTNLSNGRSTTVRITDRGPFVENRIIDLSLAAARELDMVAAGVTLVRLEVLSGGDLTTGFFAVQVGAFRERANAERLRDRLSESYSPISIQTYDSPDGTFYRVRIGKVSGEDAARQLGEQLREKEGFTPFVVRLDDNASVGALQ